MSDADDVKKRIADERPHAKFVAYSHSDEFIDQAANLGEGFHYVNLYDEQIDANVIEFKKRGVGMPYSLILIHNTYLPSFAYNLLLCWLLCTAPPEHDTTVPQLAPLLKHNFKKYFSEQLLHYCLLRTNYTNVFSRAVFLETLLFEQVCMVPVFEAKSRDSELDRKANIGAQMMSSLVSFHELGHYFLRRDPLTWSQVQNEYADVIDTLYLHVSNTYPVGFMKEEFKCDAMSVVSCLRLYGTQEGYEFCLRTIVFAFAAFSVLGSLTKSAEKTVEDQQSIPDDVDFTSIEKRHRDYTYSIGKDLDMVERSRLVTQLCENFAKKEGVVLFEAGGAFPLPSTILEDLLSYVENLLESDDRNAREMSLLVAEALHDHPHGLEFLSLRSKTFTSGRWTDTAEHTDITETRSR